MNITANIIKTDHPIMTIQGESNEIIRFEQNGNIFMHGKLVENDKEVVGAFRKFLIGQGLLTA